METVLVNTQQNGDCASKHTQLNGDCASKHTQPNGDCASKHKQLNGDCASKHTQPNGDCASKHTQPNGDCIALIVLHSVDISSLSFPLALNTVGTFAARAAITGAMHNCEEWQIKLRREFHSHSEGFMNVALIPKRLQLQQE